MCFRFAAGCQSIPDNGKFLSSAVKLSIPYTIKVSTSDYGQQYKWHMFVKILSSYIYFLSDIRSVIDFKSCELLGS